MKSRSQKNQFSQLRYLRKPNAPSSNEFNFALVQIEENIFPVLNTIGNGKVNVMLKVMSVLSFTLHRYLLRWPAAPFVRDCFKLIQSWQPHNLFSCMIVRSSVCCFPDGANDGYCSGCCFPDGADDGYCRGRLYHLLAPQSRPSGQCLLCPARTIQFFFLIYYVYAYALSVSGTCVAAKGRVRTRPPLRYFKGTYRVDDFQENCYRPNNEIELTSPWLLIPLRDNKMIRESKYLVLVIQDTTGTPQ